MAAVRYVMAEAARPWACVQASFSLMRSKLPMGTPNCFREEARRLMSSNDLAMLPAEPAPRPRRP